MNMRVLAYPRDALPWSLANTHGSLQKPNKAAFARELERNVTPAEHIPTPSTCIIDGMEWWQQNLRTGESALTRVLQEAAQRETIDVVFDVYCQTPINDAERVNRGADTTLQYKNLAGGHHIRQWWKFLCSPSNKTSLMKFLVEDTEKRCMVRSCTWPIKKPATSGPKISVRK